MIFFLILLGIVIVIILFFLLKHYFWDKPHDNIASLENKVRLLQKEKDEIQHTTAHLKDVEYGKKLNEYGKIHKELEKKNNELLDENKIKEEEIINLLSIIRQNRTSFLTDAEYDIVFDYLLSIRYKNADVYFIMLSSINNLKLLEKSESNLSAIPYMAEIISDYKTYGLEILAKQLDWGFSYQRAKKVASIREIRQSAKEMVEQNKEAEYQLSYLLSLFPNLREVIETDYNELSPNFELKTKDEEDPAIGYLSLDEYYSLDETERNQLALDRYVASHRKTKWQIGRDYELYIGYLYSQKGYDIDYFGSYMGLEDLGRDIIAKKDDRIIIIQCKYWSSKKLIHEKHITQLYGTMMSYCLENNLKKDTVCGLLITNISLSETAKRMAQLLNIQFAENKQIGDFPRIKCNLGKDSFGCTTKIYHLPFDQQYDSTKINKKGELWALTVAEAESKGFRRAYKWYGHG